MGFPLRTNSGSTQNLWGMRDYGFRGLWDKRASTVIKYPPVLTSWSTMKIDDHFQTVVSSPTNSFLEIRQLTLNKGFTPGYVESPVTDGDSDMVQSVR